jgi:hypothetical protein
MEVDKRERLRVFFGRLNAAPPASTHNAAVALFEATLNGVEDEMSGAPYNLANSPQDGRMYPPQPDNVRPYVNQTGATVGTRHRSAWHITWVGANGAIKIASARDKAIHLDKPGQDGRKVDEL